MFFWLLSIIPTFFLAQLPSLHSGALSFLPDQNLTSESDQSSVDCCKMPSLQLLNCWTCMQGRRTRGGCGCFNTHTFRDERVQHPHFFCSFSAVSHKRLTAVAPRFLWPPCVWECARCSCLLSPPSQT